MMVPVIAGAVHDGVEPGVGEAVLRVTGLDTERTAQVMLPTAPAHSTSTGSGTSCQDIQYTRSTIYNDHIVLNSKHGVTVRAVHYRSLSRQYRLLYQDKVTSVFCPFNFLVHSAKIHTEYK